MQLWFVCPLLRPAALFSAAVAATVISASLLHRRGILSPANPDPMTRSFILWLHGLGDSGPANEPIRTFFASPEFRNTKWSFPSAPYSPVACNYGAVMPSWFNIHEIPIGVASPKDEEGVFKAVKNVHAIIEKEVNAGTSPENIFVCGFSQGGALTLASVLLYPKTLGGGAIFSGWVPFNTTVEEKVSLEARKIQGAKTHQTYMSLDLLALLIGTSIMKSGDELPIKVFIHKGHVANCIKLLWKASPWKNAPQMQEGYLIETPILWSHGIADRTVLFEAGQAGPPFLEKIGMQCEFKAYPDLGHSISTEELQSLVSWIGGRLQSSVNKTD